MRRFEVVTKEKGVVKFAYQLNENDITFSTETFLATIRATISIEEAERIMYVLETDLKRREK